MLRTLRNVIALCCWGGIVALHGCSNRLGPVQATQNAGGLDRPNLPDISVEKAKECVAFDGWQLERGRIVLESTVAVDEDGDKVDVTVGGIPETARDFGICIRKVMQGMPIAEQSLHDAIKILEFNRKHAGDSHVALERFIEVIPGVPIVESELVLEADGYTVVLPVTVKVRAKLEELIDIDEATLKKIGQMALDTLGYDGIMNRAEEQGWLKTVPDEQAQSTVDKKFIGDVSLSPTPQPPVRPPPPPPPPRVITKSATKRVVVTRTAPRVVARAAPGVLAPGIGEAVVVGILVLALIDAGVLEPDGIVVGVLASAHPNGPTPSVAGAGAAVGGGAVGAVAAPITATTTTAQPAPTVVKPRRYPNQTCEDDELDRLQEEKRKICILKGGYAVNCNPKNKGLDETPCSMVKLSLVQRYACKAARWAVQDKCFGGKPDDRHEKPLDETQGGIDNCELLKLRVCAPGHPMAGK